MHYKHTRIWGGARGQEGNDGKGQVGKGQGGKCHPPNFFYQRIVLFWLLT